MRDIEPCREGRGQVSVCVCVCVCVYVYVSREVTVCFGEKEGDHQHTPTFLCPASRQTPPLSGQQVVNEGVQLVETGDAKQPVRDKKRRTRYA